jgi:hypothetical protein
MYQGYLIIFGSMILVGCPVLIPIVLIVLGILYWFAPDSFSSFLTWLRRGSSSRTAVPQTTESDPNYTFTTMKQRQEENVKRYMNPNWDPHSPENRETTERLRKIMARNKIIAQREMQEQIERERIEKGARTKG